MNSEHLFFSILIGLGNKFGNLFIFAFILTKVRAFRSIIAKKNLDIKDKLILSVIFGFFGIVGTYFSIEYNGALINTRIIGVASGGLLGGPIVGTLSGLIAGIHRGLINSGNVTSTACAVSTVFEGLMAGCMGIYVKNKSNKWIYAAVTGAIAESMRKIALLIMVKPFYLAVDLVKDIWLPMVIINSIGLALFFMIVESILKDRERAAVEKTELSLTIAERAMPLLKKGIDAKEFGDIANIIYDMTDFKAVTITNRESIIAHVGMDTPRHKVGFPVVTSLTEEALRTGKTIRQSRCTEEFCECVDICKLRSNLVLPLNDGDEVVGTIKLYKLDENSVTDFDFQMGEGLARLFSTELRIAKLENRSNMLTKAELKALQAQINPHFLFNSLTVIGSLCRTDPEKARDLIYSLSSFFRKNLNTNRDDVSIFEEIDHVKAYVEIERARFGDTMEIIYEIDENVDITIPSLTLQPIVENSIKHGLYPKKGNGFIKIQVKSEYDGNIIRIIDNGVGFDLSSMDFKKTNSEHESIGLSNVIGRLKGKFGDNIDINFQSKINYGTTFEIKIAKIQGVA